MGDFRMKRKKCKYYRKINQCERCFAQKLAPKCYCRGNKCDCEINKVVKIRKEVNKNE